MRKTTTLIVALLVCFAASTAFAHRGPVTITINEAAKKQAPVVFSHEKHTKLVKTCDVCHHMNKGLTAEKATASTKIQKCSACHLDPKGKVPSMRDVSPTKNPMHIRCIGCHKGEKKGPVACTGCHKK